MAAIGQYVRCEQTDLTGHVAQLNDEVFARPMETAARVLLVGSDDIPHKGLDAGCYFRRAFRSDACHGEISWVSVFAGARRARAVHRTEGAGVSIGWLTWTVANGDTEVCFAGRRWLLSKTLNRRPR